MAEFKVGDKVIPKVSVSALAQGDASVRTRTVLAVHGDYLWLSGVNDSALTKLAKQYAKVPPPVTVAETVEPEPFFPKGAKVKIKGSGLGKVYEVVSIHSEGGACWAWVKPVGGMEPRTYFTHSLELHAPFFEEGKRYRSNLNPRVTFEVLAVRENPGGRRVAFGKYVNLGTQAPHPPHWQTISYDNREDFPWEEA